MLPWTDRTGRFAPLRAVVFVLFLLPAISLAYGATHDGLGSRPTTEAIHQAGLMSIRLLAFGLAVTPLRVASRQARLAGIRRMLGLYALAYAGLHFGLYTYSLHFDLAKVASEIASRVYLLIGFIGFIGLLVLGATSTDGMVRRLGAPLWNRLHQIVYAIAALAVVHFFMQSKLDETEPFIMAGIFGLLGLARIAKWWQRDITLTGAAISALSAALLTGLAEAAWYALKTGAPFTLILAANFDFSYTIRPAWDVLMAGAVLVAARLARPLATKRRPVPRTADERRAVTDRA